MNRSIRLVLAVLFSGLWMPAAALCSPSQICCRTTRVEPACHVQNAKISASTPCCQHCQIQPERKDFLFIGNLFAGREAVLCRNPFSLHLETQAVESVSESHAPPRAAFSVVSSRLSLGRPPPEA